MISCSFCGKDEGQVYCVVKGPAVYICNECVALCAEIIREKRAAETQEGP